MKGRAEIRPGRWGAEVWLLAFLLSAAVHVCGAPELPVAQLAETQRVFLQDHCVECHGAQKQKGHLRLDDISFSIDSLEQAERWQKILNQINSGDMPPDDVKTPEPGAKAAFLEALSNTLVAARQEMTDVRGKITMRRLNRREYQNTLRELLGVHLPVDDLPSNAGAGLFDTSGASMFISPDQIEQYLALGRKALDEYFAQRAPSFDAGELVGEPAYRERREVELHANAMVGGTYHGYYKGGYQVAKAYLDSDRSKPPTAFGKGIADEHEAKFRVEVFEKHGPSYEHYLQDPRTQSGAYLSVHNVHPEEVIALPPEHPSGWLKTKHAVASLPPGEYVLRFRVGTVPGTPSERHFVELGSRLDEEFRLLSTFQISGTAEQPQVVEFRVQLYTGGPRRFVLREKRDVKRDEEVYRAALQETGRGPAPALWLDWVEWEGPLPQPTARVSRAGELRRLVDEPKLTGFSSEEEQARAMIERFAERAFRERPATPGFVERLLVLFRARRSAGDSFGLALREPLSAILAAPGFLYLTEPGTDETRRQLTDRELAVRLAYFLWSAPPDEALLDLARRRVLHLPEVLARETDRLLADPRSREFTAAFPHQWLGLDRLGFFQFDTKQFRDFDESAKLAARQEVYETFAALLRQNSSLTRLLQSDQVVVNGLLGQYYGLEGVTGDDFRSVLLPPDSPRGGLLGMAAILAMGSNGERTSPVERGAWVLRRLLHDPPPPAPPNVPQLNRLETQLLTTRQRLLAHQEEPQCQQCHRKIDPVGFALENFDAAGKWRTEETFAKPGGELKTWPVEVAGAFYKGPTFANFLEFRAEVAKKPESFARGFAEALIEYALGRPYGFTDRALADHMLHRAEAKNYALHEFVHALVESSEFSRK